MKMLDAIDRDDGPTILGDGSEAFDFIAVEDCARANICGIKATVSDRCYNVGTGKRTSLAEVAELILQLTGSNLPIRYAPRNQATLVLNRIGCPMRAKQDLGFEAKVQLPEGLQRLMPGGSPTSARSSSVARWPQLDGCMCE
jgi:nucleoside-diphosphate-sugar epimerase